MVQDVSAALAEAQPGTDDEVLDGPGHEDVACSAERGHSCGQRLDLWAGPVVGQACLTDMESAPELEPAACGGGPEVERTLEGSRGPVERRQHTLLSGVDEATAAARDRLVCVQAVTG